MSSNAVKQTLREKESGAALMAMVLVIFVTASTLLFSAVRPPAAIDGFDKRTFQELKAAKASLIAFSTNYASLNTDGIGPGRLPCPDAFNTGLPYDYNNIYGCDWELVLRLPERVPLPSGSEFFLNDYYADRDLQFWYAISGNFTWDKRYNASWPKINTSSNANLTLDGEEMVAVLIAPGAAVAGQDREAAENSSNRYGGDENLEYTNNDWNGATFISSYPADPENFNDIVIGITKSEIMSPATAIVVAQIKPLIDAWHPANGDSYPADSTEFDTAVAGISSWYFADQWDNEVVYTFVSDYVATINFQTDCAIIYTLTFPGDPALDPGDPIPAPVSRNTNAC